MPPDRPAIPQTMVTPPEGPPTLDLVKRPSRLRSPYRSSGERADLSNSKKAYEDSLTEFAKSLQKLDKDMLRRFEASFTPDADSVIMTVMEISKIAEKRCPNSQRDYATFSTNLFSLLQRFAPIGDIIVGGAQNLAISGAWSAIRLGIEISLSWSTVYERLSEMLLRISKSSQINYDLVSLFPSSVRLQALAYQYLTAVVEISEKIVKFANRSFIVQLSMSPIFDREFKELEQRLVDVGRCIDRCAGQEATRMSQFGHNTTHKLLKKVIATIIPEAQQQTRRNIRRRRLFDVLQANGADSMTTARRLLDKGVSSWLTSLPRFYEWKCFSTSATLWLHGSIGSGKSVTLAWAIGAVKETSGNARNDTCTTSYYFCDPLGSDAKVILSSITKQILEHRSLAGRLQDFLDDYDLESLPNEPLNGYVDLLLSIMPEGWTAFIILDGLDQCRWEDIEDVILELRRLSRSRLMKLIFSSRTNWEGFERAQYLLNSWPMFEVSMQDIDRSSEATHFINAELNKWKNENLELDGIEQQLCNQLLVGWGNMFLWLRLQLQLIYTDLRSGQQPKNILDRLPRELKQIYDKALDGIPRDKKETARSLFQVIAAATVPLKFSELRIAVNINPGQIDWVPGDLPLDPARFCWIFGKYLIEVDKQDDSVHFTHISVFQHLCSSTPQTRTQSLDATSLYEFSATEAEQHLALVCLTQLELFNSQTYAIERRKSTESCSLQPNFQVMPNTVFDDNWQVSRWAQKLYRAQQRRLNPSLQIPSDLFDYLDRSKEDYDLADFQSYAKDNWLSFSHCLKRPGIDEKGTALWDYLVTSDGFSKYMPSNLKDPTKCLAWAVPRLHIPLFCHSLQQVAPNTLQEYEPEQLGPMVRKALGMKAHAPSCAQLQHCLNLNNPYGESILPKIANILLAILLNSECQQQSPREWLELLLPYVDLQKRQAFHLYRSGEKSGNELYHNVPLPPLHYVCTFDSEGSDKISALIAYGSRIESVDHWYPIHWVVRRNQVLNVRALIKNGEDIDRKDRFGATPLMRAVDRDYINMIECLLNHGADLSLKDMYGRTALHSATVNGSLESLKILFNMR
ncbi:NACHT domain protein, partial [Fusarium sp. NRRL 25303]